MTNGGSNIRAVTKQLGLKCIYCVAHLVHLIVKDALELGSAENPNLDAVTHEFGHLLQKYRPFKSYTEMLSSDTASLALVIPTVHMAREDLA
ncbi:UNVERIFIED_CONTAM: hypothetical protein K2H54_039276 [Gekko kuhli]